MRQVRQVGKKNSLLKSILCLPPFHKVRGFIKNCSSSWGEECKVTARRIFWKCRALSPSPRKSLKTSLEIKFCVLNLLRCRFSYCLIANFISRRRRTKNTAYLYMISKHFFFELTGILLNYDRLQTPVTHY